MAGQRSTLLDLLRLGAAIGVMEAHFLTHLHQPLGLDMARLDRMNFVDIFFVLSGCLLASAYGDRVGFGAGFGNFMLQRISRLFPLHALVTLFFGIVGLALALLGLSIRVPATFDAGQIPQHLLFLQTWNIIPTPGLNTPTWSLSAELGLLLAFPLLIIVAKAGRGLIGLAVAFVMAWQLELHLPGAHHWTERTFDYGILRALPSFLAGASVCYIAKAHPTWRVPLPLTLALAALTFGAILMDMPHQLTMATYPFLTLLMLVSEREVTLPKRLQGAITHLSNLTYGVFLLHTVCGIALASVVRTLGLTPAAIIMLCVAAGIATFAAAAVTFLMVEKPARQWLLALNNRMPSFDFQFSRSAATASAAVLFAAIVVKVSLQA